ncbi:hypothetical protein [Thermotoga sp. SG1]|uniref:hypothetical protein n=1 Tax=Thermotoga sp. SG1 TaxID=126739 RepID=UPI000C7771E5|nr:hypothetical protein [Thermotoga sp. SG1]PLV56024.1 hypothetical protein AS006_05510 [Thermotoga sp. SG1]
MFRVLGWINVGLLIFNLFPFFVRVIYKLKRESRLLFHMMNIAKYFRKYHKLSGLVLIVLGFVHGYLALGGYIYFHTGTLLWILITTMFLIYLLGKLRFFRRHWIIFHRYLGVSLLVFLLLHLLTPWLF